MTAEQRMGIAAKVMCALITRRDMRFDSKKQLVDNAIAYTDMLRRRLAEVPPTAQESAEAGSRRRERISLQAN